MKQWQLLVQKVSGMTIDFHVSKRKAACAEFLKLHEILLEITSFSKLFADRIDELNALSVFQENLPMAGSKQTLQVPVAPFLFFPTIISIMSLSLVSEL